jgi:hypothetical protein
MASRFETLRNGIAVLSDDDDSHWTETDSPNIAAVEAITGLDDIGPTELSKFGRMRRRIATAADIERAATPRPAPNTKVAEKAVHDVEAAAAALEDARAAQVAADRAARAVRAALAAALTEWSAAHPTLTPEQNTRQYIAAGQLLKQQIKDGLVQAPAGPVPGNSAVDRFAVGTAGARRGGRSGGGDAFRRQGVVTRGLRLPSQR